MSASALTPAACSAATHLRPPAQPTPGACTQIQAALKLLRHLPPLSLFCRRLLQARAHADAVASKQRAAARTKKGLTQTYNPSI